MKTQKRNGHAKILAGSLAVAREKKFNTGYFFFLQLKQLAGQSGTLKNNYVELISEAFGYSTKTVYKKLLTLEKAGLVARYENRYGEKCLQLVSYTKFYGYLGLEFPAEYDPKEHANIYKIYSTDTSDMENEIAVVETGQQLAKQRNCIIEKEMIIRAGGTENLAKLNEQAIRKLKQRVKKDIAEKLENSGKSHYQIEYQILNSKSVNSRKKHTGINYDVALSEQGFAKIIGRKSRHTAAKIIERLEKNNMVEVERNRHVFIANMTYDQYAYSEFATKRGFYHSRNGKLIKRLANKIKLK